MLKKKLAKKSEGCFENRVRAVTAVEDKPF